VAILLQQAAFQANVDKAALRGRLRKRPQLRRPDYTLEKPGWKCAPQGRADRTGGPPRSQDAAGAV